MPDDRTLAAINTAVGISAIGGATYALAGAKDWPVEWLDGTPFHSYRIPGLILGGVHAPLDLAAGIALWRDHRHATKLALASGTIQIGWIAVQYRIIGMRSFLQPLLGATGLLSLTLAIRRARRQSPVEPAGAPHPGANPRA